jgi:hypothetical protein
VITNGSFANAHTHADFSIRAAKRDKPEASTLPPIERPHRRTAHEQILKSRTVAFDPISSRHKATEPFFRASWSFW